ncbi:MAG: ABC transporter substrate-binding protein [Anaerolineae bacterium]|nr:ABC transporter substrate-binding protein [Anaerolineae bacterium]MCA9893870.1 ABC transporter substrate-binding protein [Anaerolineae bacterium]
MNKIRTLVPMTLILMLMMVSPIAAQDVFPVTIEHKFGSTTITEQPQRVVSIGYTEQDFLLALGVQPVAVRYWYGDENDAIFPWADNYVEGDQPIVLNMPYGSLNYEAILELEPDLISAVTSGITQEEYEFLSTIAPTIAQTDDYIDFGMPWQDITLLIGQAVGKSAEAEALVADVEGQFAAVRAANPQFADHTVAVSFWSEDTYGYYTDEDSRGRFFVDLGFSMPEELMEVAGDSFYAYISEERMDLIDQDLIAIVNLQFIPGGQEELEAQPLFSQLAAVQAGHVIYFDETAENALGFSSPLSLSYALAAALPQLEAMFPSSDQSEAMACEEGFRAFAGTCIPENPERVFTVTDSDLDALLALGIGPIGITNGRGQTTPPRYLADSLSEDVTVAGDFFNPNLEILLGLEPDLILAAGLSDPDVLAQLNAIAPTVDTYVNGRGWQAHFLAVADALNMTSEAVRFLADYDARIAELQSELGDALNSEFIVARWAAEGPQVMAPVTFVSDVLFNLGMSSPADIPELESGHAHSAPLSLEALGILDVDWAFIGTLQSEGDAVDALNDTLQNPLFQALEVVQNDHVVVVDGSLWTSSGGPLASMLVLDVVEAALTESE